MTIQEPVAREDLRAFAITRLRKKRELQAHVLAYMTVNLFLTGIWFATTPEGFYWPMFPLLGWGIGLVFHAWDVYSPEAFSEDRIQREMQRVAGRR
jgi:2TM domain